MAKFTKQETGRIHDAINRAVRRVAFKYHLAQCDIPDMVQDAWVKVMAGYDQSKDLAATLARAQSGQTGPIKNAPTALTPEAYAYTVATTTAIDYARNLTRKHAAEHDSLDTPVISEDDGKGHLLADTLAAALDDAPTMLQASARAAAVQAALATLSPSGRDAIEAWLNNQTMTGAQRIAKMRALDTLREEISAHL